MPRLTTLRASLIGVALCLGAASASAEPHSDAALARAREVFRQGLALESARDWASALAKFREVAAVRSTVQVRFHIARCQEQLGHLNEALGAYELAMSEANGPDREEILAYAIPAVEAIRERIPRLVVTRQPGAEAVRIHLNGVELGTASIDRPLPLDPGGHELVLSEGKRERRVKLVLSEREFRTQDIEPLVPESDAVFASTTADPEVESGSAKPVLPWVMLGIAGAGLTSAGVFYFLKEEKLEELQRACGGSETECPLSARPIHTAGKRYALAANVSAAIGGVAAITGVVLWLTRPKDTEPNLGFSAGISVTGQSATLHGRF